MTKTDTQFSAAPHDGNGFIPPPYCGTRTTPPCPAEAVLLARMKLIEQLAGRKPSKDRLRKVAAKVDMQLETTLQSSLELTRSSLKRPR